MIGTIILAGSTIFFSQWRILKFFLGFLTQTFHLSFLYDSFIHLSFLIYSLLNEWCAWIFVKSNAETAYEKLEAQHCDDHVGNMKRNKQVLRRWSASLLHYLRARWHLQRQRGCKGASLVFLQHEITAHPLLLDSNEAWRDKGAKSEQEKARLRCRFESA